jgi:diaminopimelate epimerase
VTTPRSTSAGASIDFVKGHGTGNDFVVLLDPDAMLELSPARVRALCDRRLGLGADGVLRAVPTAEVEAVADLAGEAPWFMDHRNADGSLAEMCGNGIRVFVAALRAAGLVDADEVHVATRGGVRRVVVDSLGFAVSMGRADPPVDDREPVVTVGTHTWRGVAVHLPNPHAVVLVDHLEEAGRLADPPRVGPEGLFPDGVNVEFVVAKAPDHVSMRVFERGVGETQSCGTGACAVAWAWRHWQDVPGDAPRTVVVDVPGGRLQVTEREDGELVLAGPAELVARGVIDPAWWRAQ